MGRKGCGKGKIKAAVKENKGFGKKRIGLKSSLYRATMPLVIYYPERYCQSYVTTFLS